MKYVVYYRVSTKRQGESGLGLASQKAIIEHYLEGEAIAGEFTDVMSGGIRERPQLQKAIDLCKKEGYTLAVAKIDRLSRVTEDALAIYSDLEGRLYSCDIPNLDKFTLTLFMAIADRERELIKIRTKQALAEKKRKGEKLGTIENLSDAGRRKGGEVRRKNAANDPNNRRAMRLVGALRKDGLPFRSIASELNNSGYRTATDGMFQAMTVHRLFKRYQATL